MGSNLSNFGESWSDAQWGEARIKRKKITFHTKFWARGDAGTHLHGTALSDFTIVCSSCKIKQK